MCNFSVSEEDEASSSEERLLESEKQYALSPTRLERLRLSFTKLKPKLKLVTTYGRENSGYTVFTVVGYLIFWFLALWGTISIALYAHKYISDHRIIDCSCGASIAEAKTKGCLYDTMAAAWLPPACRDDELSTQFNQAGPGPDGQWYYWADRNQTKQLSLTELSHLADSGEPFFTTWDWHVAHCFWRWRKQIRGRDMMAAHLDAGAAYGHIAHCEEIMKADPAAIVASGVALNGSTFS